MQSVELFAGAGGLALGTASAGFEHQLVIDFNPHAVRTLWLNRAAGVPHACHWPIEQGDVRQWDFRPFAGQAQFVFGGPPCQPFSLGGRHRAHDDTRDMFPQAVRAIREIKPVAFFFENVKGLQRASFFNYFNYIQLQLSHPCLVRRAEETWEEHLRRLEEHHTASRTGDLEYRVIAELLNAADFGVPQRRERVFIVGVRKDVGVEFSFPSPTHSEDQLLIDQWVTGKYWERHGLLRPVTPLRLRKRVAELVHVLPGIYAPAWQTVRDAISDLTDVSRDASEHFLNPGARSYPGHTGSPYDEPAKTLKAGDHGVPGGENTLRFEDGSVRYFSVREAARLQTFPDYWQFHGPWTEAMRQLGNAVPVKLAEAVATKLRTAVADRLAPFSDPMFLQVAGTGKRP